VKNLLAQRKYERDLSASKRALEVAHEDLKEGEAKLVQAEALSALGTMAGGIIHEVNNPLNYTKTALHALKTYTPSVAETDRAEFDETVADAMDGVSRVIRIISDLRSFTTGQAGRAEQVNLAKVIEASRRLISGHLQGITLNISVPEAAEVMGNANQLTQVFQNLIQNSSSFVLYARDRGEVPTIDVRIEVSGGGSVLAVVRDNGCGIKPEDLPKIFAPFFTKRDVGQGMGLGLSICHQILSAHRAQVEVASEVNSYTEFSICFPPPDNHFEFDVSSRTNRLNTGH
jgi:C4-dicarboxylate-specific signal transduction histidine kinase